MPVIKLEVNNKVFRRWNRFLRSQDAGRLMEADLLDEWVIRGFMANVSRFLKQGGPDKADPDMVRELENQAAHARKALTRHQKRILPMFNENDQITEKEAVRLMGMEEHVVKELISQWLKDGFLAPGPGRDGEPTYILGQTWQKHQLTANRPSLNVLRIPNLMRPLEQIRSGEVPVDWDSEE